MEYCNDRHRHRLYHVKFNNIYTINILFSKRNTTNWNLLFGLKNDGNFVRNDALREKERWQEWNKCWTKMNVCWMWMWMFVCERWTNHQFRHSAITESVIWPKRFWWIWHFAWFKEKMLHWILEFALVAFIIRFPFSLWWKVYENNNNKKSVWSGLQRIIIIIIYCAGRNRFHDKFTH